MDTDSTFHNAVAAAFAAHGSLAQAKGVAHTPYSERAGQASMALAVAEAITHGQALVVEAGTGVGKTFAYLVPALHSGKRVLISTATKTLQDQLYHRDLPFVMQALGLQAKVALLKGRSNYLCTWRMQQARQQRLPAAALQELARVERWARSTTTGDFATLDGVDEKAAIRPWVSSTRENCLGQNCPDYKNCFVLQARKEAMQAEVVVVNHHLFFADMAVRESGVAELLPTVGVTIFDEAHQLNETGVQFLGLRLSSHQLLDFARDVLAAGLQRARGWCDWQELVSTLEFATRELRLCAASLTGGAKLRWVQAVPEGVDPAAWQAGVEDICRALAAVHTALESVHDTHVELARLHERAQTLLATVAHFQREPAGDDVRWLELHTHWTMVQSPLDIAAAMRERVLRATPAPAMPTPDAPAFARLPALAPLLPATTLDAPAIQIAPQQAWVFTSATLGNDAQLSWFTEPCGLQEARVLRVQSPFDYAAQAALYVPAHLPAPADTQAHSLAVAQLVADSARVLQGKTLVLTTTNRALRAIAKQLRSLLADTGIAVLEQGEGAKAQLIAQLRDALHGQPCVLVATASLWEGVDIPGDALQQVVIDKLPFPPPNDPLVEARSARLTQQGKSPFAHYALPEAAVALKQGAGRLIRSERDRGVLVVCDVRLTQMGYGRRLLSTLPPMTVLPDAAAYAAYVQQLRTPTGAAPHTPRSDI